MVWLVKFAMALDLAYEVCHGAGFGLPVIIDMGKEEDAEALLSYLPFFLGKGTFKGQLVSEGSSSPSKPILVITPSPMTLANIQLLFRTYSFFPETK